MTLTVLKSHEFKRRPAAAKRAASEATVVITEYGRPAFVMLSMDAYRLLVGSRELSAPVELDCSLRTLVFWGS